MVNTLTRFAELTVREGLVFDRERTCWVNRKNEPVSICSNGQMFREAPIWIKVKELFLRVFVRCLDMIRRCLCMTQKGSYFSPSESAVMKLHNQIHKELKAEVESLCTFQSYLGASAEQQGKTMQRIDHEMRNAYAPVTSAAQHIWKTKTFSKTVENEPVFKYCKIKPFVDFLLKGSSVSVSYGIA